MTDKLFAYHVDLKRAMWRPEYFATMAKRLRPWGYNAFVIEIEDKFRYRNHPAIVHPDAPSHADWRAIAKACRAEGIEIVPLMQSLGHVEFIVGKPEYARLREAPDIEKQFDPTSKEALALLYELYDEVIEVLRPKEFFHVGGDETWQLGQSAKCRPLVEKIGVGGLYLQFMLPLFEHVHARGLRPMVWADIFLSHPEIIPRAPKHTVMVDWEYGITEERPRQFRIWGGSREKGTLNKVYTWDEYRKADRPEFRAGFEKYVVDDRTRRDGTFVGFYCTDALLGSGFDVVTAPANRCAGDMAGTPRSTMHWPNCFYFARKGMARGIGTLVTSWTVRHNHPDLCLAGTFAASQGVRMADAFDAEALGRAFTKEMYGVEFPRFTAAVLRASDSFSLGQAGHLVNARAALAAGKDPLAAYLEGVDKVPGGRKDALAEKRRTATGYAEAGRALAAMKHRAKRNAHQFDFWLEGIAFNLLCTDCVIAALDGSLKKKASSLRRRLRYRRDITRALFAETYPPRSVEEEIALRYGFWDEVLKRNEKK